MGGVEGGRKGRMPLIFQEYMRRLSAVDVEGGSWAERGGGDEGMGGEGGWIRGGWSSEIRRRLRGGGLISVEGIVLSE